MKRILSLFLMIIMGITLFTSKAYADTSFTDVIKGPSGWGVAISGTITTRMTIKFSQDNTYNYYSFLVNNSYCPSKTYTLGSGYASNSFYFSVSANSANQATIFAAEPDNATAGQSLNVTISWPPSISFTVTDNKLNFTKLNDLPYFVDWKGDFGYDVLKQLNFKPAFTLRVPKSFVQSNAYKNYTIGNVYMQYDLIAWPSTRIAKGYYNINLNYGNILISRVY